MFQELSASLARRGVIVKVEGHYSAVHERMNLTAHVKTDKFGVEESWPHVEFTVRGGSLDEIAEDIKARLPLVDTVIDARQKHREHRAAVVAAARAGEALRAACGMEDSTLKQLRHPQLEPNMDAKTARQQPIA